MIKKFFFIILLFIVALAGLQFFGGRDFTQVSLAWDKYQLSEDFGDFMSDVGVIFKGETVKDSLIPAEYANKMYYRWTDGAGRVQYSERMPNVENYEEISIKDLPFSMQEAMSKEEIDGALRK